MTKALNPINWVSTILGGGEKPPSPTIIQQAPPPPAPEPKPVPVMPTPDDDAIRKAQAASISKQRARKGRQSTILTSDSETLG